MKKIAFYLLFLIVANSVELKKIYLGFGVGSGSGSEEWAYGKTGTPYLGYTYSDLNDYDYDVSIKDFKFGFDYGGPRLEVAFTSIYADFSGTRKSFSGVDFDYILPFLKDENEIFPFISVGLGRYSGSASKYFYGLSGFSFSLAFGALYSVTDEFEMELSYKAKIIQWAEITQAGSDDLDISEQISYFYLATKYRFSSF